MSMIMEDVSREMAVVMSLLKSLIIVWINYCLMEGDYVVLLWTFFIVDLGHSRSIPCV